MLSTYAQVRTKKERRKGRKLPLSNSMSRVSLFFFHPYSSFSLQFTYLSLYLLFLSSLFFSLFLILFLFHFDQALFFLSVFQSCAVYSSSFLLVFAASSLSISIFSSLFSHLIVTTITHFDLHEHRIA